MKNQGEFNHININMDELDKDYWTNRYQTQNAGWDIGGISTPLKLYIDQLNDPSIKVLIPGCGNGHEGVYLWDKGFSNITLLDFSEAPLANLKARRPDIPNSILKNENFFEHEGQYDLILEQTLFCALDPRLREAYVQKIVTLLRPGGKLIGVFFDRSFDESPPFGGTKDEYESLFSKYFSEMSIEPCYNSIPKRENTELFVRLIKS